MKDNKMLDYIQDVLDNMPASWLALTTHRLDIYDESLAKVQFLDQFENLFRDSNARSTVLSELPTAYDYIRLGHPLSCVLEWVVGKSIGIVTDNVISFSSKSIPVFAILRKNLLEDRKTLIAYEGELPAGIDTDILNRVYGYNFKLQKVQNASSIGDFDGSVIYLSRSSSELSTVKDICSFELADNVDFYINTHDLLGSILVINGDQNASYVSDIQHVRRRETIAMTPVNCLATLNALTGRAVAIADAANVQKSKSAVVESIKEIAGTPTKALIASSGLSIQYAIMMGLINDALDNHPGKDIKIIVPPNCYGGTNDQARRVADCIDNVEVVDLPVDGDNDMVRSIDIVLNQLASENAVPYIIAEIPTNPRVEVPDLDALKAVLGAERKTGSGEIAIDPVFILDQTFCPNVHFLGDGAILSSIRTISYASGSKFPSGGRCTAGYCIGNRQTDTLIEKIEMHLQLCDNEATDLQLEILAEQLPSMIQRIADAYRNTREFVTFITTTLPEAKINFVSEKLAAEGFTPSVFSLDLPTKGETDAERETYKRAQNLKLIHLMINQIPDESKFCVSYGQLKGCYWTVPATSTQGTTKEGDKDYIVRASLSPDLDLARHKEVFQQFVESI